MMRDHKRLTPLLACILLALFTASCANRHVPAACEQLDDPELYIETSDPFEPANRAIFDFNDALDKAFFEKTAKSYRKITPDPVERSISNFFNNLKEPRNILARTATANPDAAAQSAIRFVVNTTIGIAGWLDVAGELGIPYRDYEIGDSLGYWGVPEGPYLVMPFFGPTNARTGVGSLVQNKHTYVIKHIKKSENQVFVQQMSYLDSRARLLKFTDVLKLQPDPYLFARESYRQSRLNEMCTP